MEKAEGLKNIVRLAAIVGLMGGGVEELKDFLIGRNTPFWENVSDEVLNLFFLSRYSLEAAKRTGPSAIIDSFLSIPALGFVDALAKIIDGDFSVFKYVPIPLSKELYYNFSTSGRDSILSGETPVPLCARGQSCPQSGASAAFLHREERPASQVAQAHPHLQCGRCLS